MGLIINQDKVTKEIAKELIDICPFAALEMNGSELVANEGCKACKVCVKKGPSGVCEWVDEPKGPTVNKDEWRGIAVFAQQHKGKVHPVSLELVGKAKELASVINHPVYAVIIGNDIDACANELLQYGVDKVFVYDNLAFDEFVITPYTNAFTHFIQTIKPSSILVGATVLGRSLAPKVAARVHSGLTADCTILKMKENTDLVQIRPAFGGNIMAQIITPDTRPQFCTVRYKIFDAPQKVEPFGEVISMEIPADQLKGDTQVLDVKPLPEEIDISDADVIVACGRGVKTQDDLSMAKELSEALGAQMACTRPLIENGWFDPRRQIGLSGRTVKPKLIVCLGVSGSVQFAAGMNSSEKIIAVNSDPNANIFDIAHEGFVGDIYEIVPELINKIREAK